MPDGPLGNLSPGGGELLYKLHRLLGGNFEITSKSHQDPVLWVWLGFFHS